MNRLARICLILGSLLFSGHAQAQLTQAIYDLGYNECLSNTASSPDFSMYISFPGNGITFLQGVEVINLGGAVGTCILGLGFDAVPNQVNPTSDHPVNQCGSIIQVDNLAVGESIPLSGTTESLNYFSNRVIGRASDYTVKIPVLAYGNAPTTPVQMRLRIAGQTYSQTFDPSTITPGQVWSFTWNGKDSTGVDVPGSATLYIDYLNKFQYPGTITGDTAITNSVTLGGWKAINAGIGGLMLSSHHFYDPLMKRIFYGNGNIRQVDAISVLKDVNGNIRTPVGDEVANLYLVAAEDGSEVYIFESTGRHLETRSARTGAIKKTFAYVSGFKLDGVTDSFGNQIKIEYVSTSQIRIHAPHGQTTTLTLNSDGLPITVVDANGNTYKMSYYNSLGLMATFQKPSGEISTLTYDSSGLLTKDSSTAGSFWNIFYTLNGSSRSIRMNTAEGREYNYSIVDQASGFMRTEAGPGGATTTTEYFPQSYTSIADPTGTRTVVFLGPDARFSYMVPQSRQSYIAPPTSSPLTTDKTVTPTFAPSNLLALTANSIQDTIADQVWQSTYTGATQTNVVTSPEGRVTTTTLNSVDQVVRVQAGTLFPVNVSYDTSGRVTQIAQGARTTTMTYGSDGYLASVANSLNQSTQFVNDANGNAIKKILPDGRIIAMGFDGNGNLISVTPPSRPAHAITYNLFDLIASYAPPAILGSSGSTFYQYNRDKQITQITKADGTLVNFTYFPTSGLLQTLSAPEGNYSRTYNDANQLTSLSSPAAANLSWSYSGNLMTKQSLSSSGITVDLNYSYDKLLPTEQTLVVGTISSPIPLTYDRDRLLAKAGNLTLTRDPASGLVTSTQLGNIVENYTYDPQFGEVADVTASNGGTLLFHETYTRDALGRITSKTVTVGSTTTTLAYAYDDSGRLTQVSTNGAVSRTYSYDANSNRTAVQTSGVTTTCPQPTTHPKKCAQELIKILLKKEIAKYCKDRSDHDHKKDHGRKNDRDHKKAKFIPSFLLQGYIAHAEKHHHKHRGICDEGHGDHDDDDGPSTCTPQSTTVTTNAAYDNQDRLLTYGGTTYTYNAKGEVAVAAASSTSSTISFDSLGALAKVVKTGSTTDTFTYVNDGLGRRVEVRQNGSLVSRFVYDERSRVIAVLNPNGTLQSQFIYATIGNSPDYLIQGGVDYKIIHDQLGSVRLVVNSATGAVVSKIDYDEFGNIASTSINPNFQPLGFAAGLRDLASNYVRFGARDYDPETGRWLSKDPILFKGGDTNLYGYTMNDPVNLIDPRGTDADTYTTFPIHEVIRITDPNSPTGHTFFEFYPREGAGLFTPVPGAAQHGSTYPDLLFPIGHYPLTPDQDQAMLRRGYDLENRANQGDYPYSLTGSGGGHNCVGFVNDVCGGACK